MPASSSSVVMIATYRSVMACSSGWSAAYVRTAWRTGSSSASRPGGMWELMGTPCLTGTGSAVLRIGGPRGARDHRRSSAPRADVGKAAAEELWIARSFDQCGRLVGFQGAAGHGRAGQGGHAEPVELGQRGVRADDVELGVGIDV